MAKLTLADLETLQNETSAVNTINSNSAGIETALENTLSRDGSSPNQMNTDLDMNGNEILNLPAASDPTSPLRKNEYDFDTALLSTLQGQVATIVGGLPPAAFSSSRFVSTGANPYVAGLSGIDNADLLIGSLNFGPRHDSSIMMWTNASANRLSSVGRRFNFDEYLTTGGAGAYITGEVGGDSYFSGPVLIKDGRPWADIRAFGQTLGTNDDWSGAIQDALNYISSRYGGGTVLVPPNTGGNPYICLSDVTVPAYTTLKGTGPTSTLGNGHNEFSVILNGTLASLEDISVLGKGTNNDTGTFGATKPAIKVNATAVEARLINVGAQGGKYNMELRAADTMVFNCVARGAAYGNAMVYCCAGMWFVKNKFDQAWPHSVSGTNITTLSAIPAWQANTAYNAGDVVSFSGYMLQATVGGTSHLTTPPTLKNSGIAITDNTVTWALIGQTTYYGLQIDGPVGSGVNEVQINQMDLTGSFTAGLALTNTQVGGSDPKEIKVSQLVSGQCIQAAIWIVAGGNATITDCELAGGAFNTGSCVIVGSGSTGGNVIHGNDMLGTRNGIELQAGANNIITSNKINGCTNAGILVSNGVSHTVISGNLLGSHAGVSPNNLYPVRVQNGALKYSISGNIFTGSTNDIENLGAAGANQSVTGNVF